MDTSTISMVIFHGYVEVPEGTENGTIEIVTFPMKNMVMFHPYVKFTITARAIVNLPGFLISFHWLKCTLW